MDYIIGENIRKFREIKGLTREDIADKLKLSLSAYSRIEQGKTDLTLSRILEISKILDVDLSQIMKFDATQIFNNSNVHIVQGQGAKAETVNFHTDDHKEKYIKLLEEEIKRLKGGK